MVQDKNIQEFSYGPSPLVRTYPGFIVNGYRFHTLEYGQNKTTMNSGVCVKGSVYNDDEIDYYGLLEEVIELQYLGPNNSIFLFKCHWFDPTSVRHDKMYGIVDIKHKSKLSTYEPFILTAQAQQVHYSSYITQRNKDWWAVQRVKPRLLPSYNLDLCDVVSEDANMEFQFDQTDTIELTASVHLQMDTIDEPVSLCVENEMEEIDEDDLEEGILREEEEEKSSEEEELDISSTSDDESEDCDDEAELDISDDD